MRAGPLDRRVSIQRRTLTTSDSGDASETWLAIGSDRWASKRPVSGTERYSGPQLEAREQIEFQLRWSEDLADLQPVDRIIEPAADATASPSTPIRSIYDIIAVHEIGRREALSVITTRHVISV